MHESNATSGLFNMVIDNGSWPAHVFNRFADVFSSHVIQVDIETAGSSNNYNFSSSPSQSVK